jgi:hypothetical protein
MKHTKEYKRDLSRRVKQWWVDIKKDPKRLEIFKDKLRKNNAKNMLGKRGSLSPSWKGGRIISKRDGYVLVVAPPNHPYAKNGGGKNRSKYILEHRLVMEKVLGRYLLPNEDVNHLNGKKDDNRPENLRLVRHYAHYEEMCCPKCNYKFLTR